MFLNKKYFYFLPMKKRKNWAQKLVIISPKLFFHMYGPAVQTSPELIFHIIKMSPQDSSVSWSVYRMYWSYCHSSIRITISDVCHPTDLQLLLWPLTTTKISAFSDPLLLVCLCSTCSSRANSNFSQSTQEILRPLALAAFFSGKQKNTWSRSGI